MTHRERLLEVGYRSLSACGYNGTRVDALLVEADVPKGSFYHHFGTKESFSLAQRFHSLLSGTDAGFGFSRSRTGSLTASPGSSFTLHQIHLFPTTSFNP